MGTILRLRAGTVFSRSVAICSPLDRTSAQRAFQKRPYSPYAERKFPTRPLFGDTHVHTSFSMDAGGNTDVYSIQDGGTDLRRITTDPASDGSPSWSPDGSQLAFVSDRDGEPRVYRINADGTDEVRLTDGSAGGSLGRDISPAWSRDGSRIAFVHGDRIFTMAAPRISLPLISICSGITVPG